MEDLSMTDYRNLDDKTFGTMRAREERPAEKQRRTGMAGLSDRELIKFALNKPFDLFTDSMADDVLKVYEKTSTNSNDFTEELTKIEGIDMDTYKNYCLFVFRSCFLNIRFLME